MIEEDLVANSHDLRLRNRCVQIARERLRSGFRSKRGVQHELRVIEDIRPPQPS